MTEPILTPIDRQSVVWLKLKKYLEAQLELLRKRNDGDLDERKTARLRGRIAAVQDLISQGTDKPHAPSEDELFKD
jgi:hypothetical protein